MAHKVKNNILGLKDICIFGEGNDGRSKHCLFGNFLQETCQEIRVWLKELLDWNTLLSLDLMAATVGGGE